MRNNHDGEKKNKGDCMEKKKKNPIVNRRDRLKGSFLDQKKGREPKRSKLIKKGGISFRERDTREGTNHEEKDGSCQGATLWFVAQRGTQEKDQQMANLCRIWSGGAWQCRGGEGENL